LSVSAHLDILFSSHFFDGLVATEPQEFDLIVISVSFLSIRWNASKRLYSPII